VGGTNIHRFPLTELSINRAKPKTSSRPVIEKPINQSVRPRSSQINHLANSKINKFSIDGGDGDGISGV